MNEPDGRERDQNDKPIIDERLRRNVSSRATWLRLFYMLIFMIVLCLAGLVLAAVVIVQFFTVLLSSQRNDRLLEFGADMSLYIYQIWQYLAFVTDAQPFPFGEWHRSEVPEKDTDET